MALISLHNISLAFSDQPLLDDVSFSIEHDERVCLIGRNGTGKSTLFNVITGNQQADDGQIAGADSIRITQLEQAVPVGISGSVFDVVAGGLGEAGKLVQRYHDLSLRVAADTSLLNELESCQQALENADGWEINRRVETTLARLNLDGEVSIDTLSGGLKRRVLLARALVTQPDLLLLDEPTNHLDIRAIEWLEGFLTSASISLLFITHDRAFLRKLATRVIELDRGQLTDWPGGYEQYLRGKQQQLETEAKHNALFDKRLAEEERWIRQGIKARRTRNEGRVRALKAMRREREGRREQLGKAKLATQTHKLSGKIVAETQALGFAFGGTPVIKSLTTTLLRGDKIGIIGPNGCGKTTLIKLLLDQLEPTSGEVQLGTNLEIAYFDQYRSLIDPKKTVQDNVADGSDTVTINGKSRHVIGYLGDFLFTPRRVRQPAEALSGGERNRLMLAKLFTRPANLLVMDEPTNDLDMDTLDLLENLLVEYQGTLLLVSHDRAFINNVVTSTLVFEGEGVVNEYIGGYDDWLRQRAHTQADAVSLSTATAHTASKNTTTSSKSVTAKPKKLSYQLQRELDAIPGQIDQLEVRQTELTEAMSGSAFYQQSAEAIAGHQAELQSVTEQLDVLFARWEVLEDR